MPATVALRPISVGHGSMVSGQAVGPADWMGAANAYNGLVGAGSALMPMGGMSISIPGDDTLAPPFRVWPRYATSHRLWLVSASGEGNHTFTDPSGGAVPLSIPASSGVAFRAYVETIAARTGAETTVSPSFHCASGKQLTINGLGCFEIPRVALAVGGSDLTTSDGGMDGSTVLRTGLPIADDYAGAGVGFIARELDALRDDARRTGLFAWASGGDNAIFVGTSFTSILQTSPFALGRYLYNGQTQATIQLAGYGAPGGSFRWTATSGATVTAVCDATGLARAQLLVDCEDLATADGRRSSRSDAVLVEARAASGSMIVQSVTMGEGASSATDAAAASAPRRPRPFRRGPLPPFMADRRRR